MAEITDNGLEVLRKAAEPATQNNKYDLRIALSSGGPFGDAFGRLRISQPVTLFDSQSQYNRQLLQFFEKTTGSGSLTHNPDESSVDLDVTTASGDEVIRQTKRYVRYQPGKSQLVLTTFAFGPSQTNTTKLVGYGDDENGIFLKNEGGSISITKRSKSSGSVVDTDIAQASWNEDNFDGNGPSGITLDAEKTLIFWTSIEWLGVGQVRAGFVIEGNFHTAHKFNHSNIETTTYMTTANLPVRYQITVDDTNASADSMKSICCTVISEGGFETERGFPFSTTHTTEVGVGNTGFDPVLAIRPRALFNSITNRLELLRPKLQAYTTGNDAFLQIVYDPTITGGTWADVDTTYSAVETSIDMTSYTGGIVLDNFALGSSSGRSIDPLEIDILARLPFCLDIDGNNPIAILIGAQSTAGAGSDVFASLSWLELT